MTITTNNSPLQSSAAWPAPKRKRGRPPKVDDSQRDAKERLLKVGVAILTEKGFSAVGLDEILKAAAVPKGSFYHYFPSKEAFGLALIEAYDAYFRHKLDSFFGNESRPPLARLRDFIEDAQAGMARYQFRRGCLVGNLGQEMGNLPEAYRLKLMQVFESWQSKTAACLKAAQDAGDIAQHHDCEGLAAFFWIGWEGAVLRAKLEASLAPLEAFAAPFMNMLNTPN